LLAGQALSMLGRGEQEFVLRLLLYSPRGAGIKPDISQWQPIDSRESWQTFRCSSATLRVIVQAAPAVRRVFEVYRVLACLALL